jgi:tetratricopeptide (TPR) repeat protein
MTTVMVRYVWLLFWPGGLSAFYGYPAKNAIDIEVVGAMLLLLATAGAAWYLARTNRKMFFWAAVTVLGIMPVSQIIPLVTLMNDRYLYFPMLGAAALIPGLIYNLRTSADRAKKIYVIPVLATLIFVLAIVSFNRSKVWQNSFTLWSDAHEKFPKHPLPSFGLGSIYLQRCDLQRARDYFLEAYQLGMKTNMVVLNLGRISLSLGDLAQAEIYITALNAKYPDYPLGLMLLGDYYRRVGNDAAATKAYNRVKHLP